MLSYWGMGVTEINRSFFTFVSIEFPGNFLRFDCLFGEGGGGEVLKHIKKTYSVTRVHEGLLVMQGPSQTI